MNNDLQSKIAAAKKRYSTVTITITMNHDEADGVINALAREIGMGYDNVDDMETVLAMIESQTDALNSSLI